MKKTNNYRIIVLILIAIFASLTVGVKTVYAEKLNCYQIPINYCPDGGKDSYGDACKLGYNGSVYGCMKNTTAKKCSDYQSTGTCPYKDDYGNVCNGDPSTCYIYQESENIELKTCDEYEDYKTCPIGKTDYKGNVCNTDSSGKCYISINKQKCEDIKKQDICNNRSDDCKWLLYNGRNQCFTLIKPTATSETCETITDYLTCSLRTDCEYLSNSKGKMECKSVVVPTDSSPACGTLSKYDCKLRTDCDPDVDAAGNDICVDKNNPSGIGKGSSLVKVDIPFMCSDVKILTWIWNGLRVIAPFLVILFGSLDWFKAVISSDEKKMKESRGKFIKRIIVFILLIFVPFVVQFIFQTAGTYGSENMCLVKCILTNDTSSKGCE